MYHSACKGEHVAHGNEHVHFPKLLVDSQIVRAVDQHSGVVFSDLHADTGFFLYAVLLVDQHYQWRGQVQANNQLSQEARGQRARLQ